MGRLAGERTLKEHDRAVLANAVNQWRGVQSSSAAGQASHSSPMGNGPGQIRQHWPGYEQTSEDVSSEPLDGFHASAWQSAASEITDSIGTSAELSLADLPTPTGHQ